jgi:outer membrane protein assembly factor BamD
MLKIGECEMRQMGLPDRQITNARRAEQRLKAGMQQYPKSPLRAEFQKRLDEVQENLANHDLGVGNFYYNRFKNRNGGLKGAQSRYREIVQKYPVFSRMDEVLFKLADTYVQEEEPDEAVKYLQRIVRDYPNCEFAERAKEQLQVIGGSIPEPNPERKAVPCVEGPSMLQTLKSEVIGTTPLTVDKSGVLVDKDHSKERRDLLDGIIERQGELPDLSAPDAITSPRRAAPSPTPAKAANTTPPNR